MLTPYTVFIIDDDEDDRELFKEVVTEISPAINCITANNGQDALQLLHGNKSLHPNFIFLDLNLPRFNGKQCLEYLKKKEELSSIPVIILHYLKTCRRY